MVVIGICYEHHLTTSIVVDDGMSANDAVKQLMKEKELIAEDLGEVLLVNGSEVQSFDEKFIDSVV